MSNVEQGQPTPGITANVPVTEVSPAAAQARMIVDAMKDRVAENRVSDIKLAIAGFATVLFAFAGGYLLIDSKLAKLSEKLDAFAVSNAKIETKLDDLIARIPPVPTSPPRRN